MIEQRQKRLTLLPADQGWGISLTPAGSLQYSPVAQNQGSRDLLDHGVRKGFENDFGTDSCRIAHGNGDDRPIRHEIRNSVPEERGSLTALVIAETRDYGFFEENGFNESKMFEMAPFSESFS